MSSEEKAWFLAQRRLLRREIARAPRGHWGVGISADQILSAGLPLGARSLPEAFQKLYPGRIEEYWQMALPHASREVVLRFWAPQAAALGVAEEWDEAFAAVC